MLLAAAEPVLILAPAMVLDSGTWDDEIAKWTPDLIATQVSYSSLCARNPKGRVYRDHQGFPIVEVRDEILAKEPRTVIVDESHYIKGRKTSWTAGLHKLLDQFPDAQVDFATGTPIPNWAHEAFTVLQFIYPEEARPKGKFGSYWRWANEWFDVGPTLWSPMDVGELKNDTDEGWAEFRQENWGNRMILRLREDCLDLPPLTLTKWRCKMGKDQARVYKALKRDYIAWLDTGLEIVAWNSAAQMVKLAKCATGLEVLDPEAKGSAKLDALQTILTDRPRPTLVVGYYRDTVAACARVAENLGKSVMILDGATAGQGRRAAIRAFQSGSLDVLCASIELVSEGMTLHQGGADQIVRVERDPRPHKNEQVMRRLHRIGVEVPVQVIDLVTADTWDERLSRLLANKSEQQMKALGTAELKALA